MENDRKESLTGAALAAYLDQLLNVKAIRDGGYNGLQVAHQAKEITKAAFAVDACLDSFRGTAEAGAQILIVHHGMMWDKLGPLVGATYERIRFLITHDLALYAAHLPLDLHPELGHNAQIAKMLQLQDIQPFGEYRGQYVGFCGRLPQPVDFDTFCRDYERLNRGPIQALGFGKKLVSSVAILSGDGAVACDEAIAKDMDVFITGETNYIAYYPVKENKLNLIYGGHYHTEKFGMFALADHLQEKFGLETVFLDYPIGF